MRSPRHILPTVVFGLWTAIVAAQNQPTGIPWQHDLEGAKVLAKQTGRLVLVHFWTPECAPCQSLERSVFNQPGVAGAVEAQFVPVKLDANQNPGIAQSFGITRVPTDVIITPEGEIVDKIISPPTPSGYVSEVGQIATQYLSRRANAFANAAAGAPQPSLLNSSYAAMPPTGAGLTAPGAAQQGTPPVGSPIGGSLPTGGQYGAIAGNAPAGTTVPAQGIDPNAPAPGADRYQTQFATSQSIATQDQNLVQPGLPAPSVALNPHLATSPPAAAAPVAPAVVNNQYLTGPAPAIGQAPGIAGQGLGQTAPITPAPVGGTGTAPGLANAEGLPSAPIPTQAPAPSAPTALNLAAGAPVVTPGGPSALPQSSAPAPSAAPSPSAPEAASAPAAGSAQSFPIGFDGYCTVTMRNAWKWVEGDKRWGVNHRGRLYLFAGEQEQQQFLQNPDYYAPALSGIDPVLAIEHRQTVPGLRQHSVDYDHQIYLFASEATLQQFTANPERYAESVRQAMGIERGELVR